MIWGHMTSKGTNHMCEISGTMVQMLYKSILGDDLLQTIGCYNSDAMKVIFRHDNDLGRTAKTIQQWLTEQSL